MKQIILASSSPRRKQLLDQIGVPSLIVPSNIEEKMNAALTPTQQVEQFSLQKGLAVAQLYNNSLIIAADTLVVLDKELIGKPKSKQDAKNILRKLSGRSHTVITGFTIIDTQSRKTVTKSVKTTAWINMTEKEINEYVASGEPMGKAGAYAVQEKGALFLEKIEGDFFNVVGLPIFALTKELKRFGVSTSSNSNNK